MRGPDSPVPPPAADFGQCRFALDPAASQVHIEACCKVSGKTGVEMEALTAASVAALTIYDMCKAVDRGMEIRTIRLLQKEGGKSGSGSGCPAVTCLMLKVLFFARVREQLGCASLESALARRCRQPGWTAGAAVS